ncbi:MAG: hypothetical protein ACHP7D_01020 [Lysobacterales bacterium]
MQEALIYQGFLFLARSRLIDLAGRPDTGVSPAIPLHLARIGACRMRLPCSKPLTDRRRLFRSRHRRQLIVDLECEGGVQRVPGMSFAFGVTNDGKTVAGSTGFFDNPPRAAMIWREGIGTATAAQYLVEKGISVPAGWDPTLAGGFGGISGDGTLMAGWSFGPLGTQSYIIKVRCDHPLIASESACTHAAPGVRIGAAAPHMAAGR